MFSSRLNVNRGKLLPLARRFRSLVNLNTSAFAHTTRAYSTRPALTTLSQDEQMLQQAVRTFATNEIKPLVSSMDESMTMDRSILDQCFAQGLMGIEIPASAQGAGLSFMSSIIAIEELAKIDPSVSVCVDVQNTLVNNMFSRFGSSALQAEYFPKLATTHIGSFCLSESSSGSDAFALKTTAKVDPADKDYYVLNGAKAWITNANEAGVFVVMATVDPSAGYKGITAFVVDVENPGLVVGAKENKLGIRASSTCEVVLDNARVHKSKVLGEVGKGYKIAIETLNEGRIGIGAQMVGLAQGALDRTMPWLVERKQFGQSIANFQGMQFDYAQLAVDIEAARLMVYNAARLKEDGRDFVQAAAMAKLLASQVAERVASKCVTMSGGIGFTKEFGVEKFYRDALIGQIYEGTTNIQLQTIAKSMLKDL